jgi:hypothetical protein
MINIIVEGYEDAENLYGPFYSSKPARSFHRPGCKWLRNILQRNLIKYDSHADAVKDGKKTCKSCNS